MKKLSLITLVTLFAMFANAQTNYYTRIAGSWSSNINTWSMVSHSGSACSCDPGASLAGSNTAYIYNTITATTLTSQAGSSKITVESGDTLTITTSTFAVSGSANITVNGTLILNGALTMAGSSSIVNNGNVIINGNVTNSGSTTVANNGSMTINGNVETSGSASFTGATVYVSGTITGSNTSTLSQMPITWQKNGTSIYYNSGSVGIGTETPNSPLQVKGQIAADSASFTGRVSIETSSTKYALNVGGVVTCQDIKACLNGCDFVFENNYKLMPLKDLENYLNLNHHLPGIASAAEMENSDGVALGKLNTELLQKVEELTLYIIQQDKKMDELEKKVDALSNEHK